MRWRSGGTATVAPESAVVSSGSGSSADDDETTVSADQQQQQQQQQQHAQQTLSSSLDEDDEPDTSSCRDPVHPADDCGDYDRNEKDPLRGRLGSSSSASSSHSSPDRGATPVEEDSSLKVNSSLAEEEKKQSENADSADDDPPPRDRGGSGGGGDSSRSPAGCNGASGGGGSSSMSSGDRAAAGSSSGRATPLQDDVVNDDDGADHAEPQSPVIPWKPQQAQSTCEFTHTITDYAQKRESGCKKAEYSATTVDEYGNRWRLIVYVNGNGRASNHHLSLFLQVADADDLPFGWKKAVSYVLTLEHPSGGNLSYAKRNPDKTFKLCPKAIDWGWSQFITSDRIQQEGFVSEDCLTVRASVTVKSSSVSIDEEDSELYLKCAVEEGDAEAVKLCLDQGASVNCKFKDDLYTPLHTACSSGTNTGSMEVLNLLLESGANGNACNKWRETPLLIAANNGHRAAVQALLRHGADPSLCSEAGWSALTFAAHKGFDDIVALLLKAGAPVNCRVTEDASTPLHKACAGSKDGHLPSVELLLAGGADVHALNKWRETPLLTAANHGQAGAVEALLGAGADPCKCTDTGWSPLSIAAYKGHDDVVRLLLEEGAPTEEDDPTLSALLQAATKGLPDTVELLLRHGADHTVTTKKGDTALSILVEQNLIDAAVEMVTEYSASIPRCSRDRKKVQRARLLINLRMKQLEREGKNGTVSTDDEDDETDDDSEDARLALHEENGDSPPSRTAHPRKKKKKQGKSPEIAEAEEKARAAEAELLLELEQEDAKAKKEQADANSKRAKKRKKKERERQQKLKEERARREREEREAQEREKARKEKEEKERKIRELRMKEQREREMLEMMEREKVLAAKRREREERERREREQKQREKQTHGSGPTSPSGESSGSSEKRTKPRSKKSSNGSTPSHPVSRQVASKHNSNVLVKQNGTVPAKRNGTVLAKHNVKASAPQARAPQASAPAPAPSPVPAPVPAPAPVVPAPAAPLGGNRRWETDAKTSRVGTVQVNQTHLSVEETNPSIQRSTSHPELSSKAPTQSIILSPRPVGKIASIERNAYLPCSRSHGDGANGSLHSASSEAVVNGVHSQLLGGTVEHPVVALCRRDKVLELLQQCKQSVPVVEEGTLKRVISRWSVRASHGQTPAIDPLIPSGSDFDSLVAYFQRQFISESRKVGLSSGSCPEMTSMEALKEAGTSVAMLCQNAAKEVDLFGRRVEEQLPPDWTDAALGMQATESGSVVTLSWANRANVYIASQTFATLRDRHVGPPSRFLAAAFAAKIWYETKRQLVADSVMELRLPPVTQSALSTEASVSAELWSDPFSALSSNVFWGNFEEVDSLFGGQKPFGKYERSGEDVLARHGGSVAVLLPFDTMVASSYLKRMLQILDSASTANVAVSFAVFIHAECFHDLPNGPSSPSDLQRLEPRFGEHKRTYVRRVEILRAGQHVFQHGEGDGSPQVNPSSSLFVVLQTEAGRSRFDINDTSVARIISSMSVNLPSPNEESIVTPLGFSSDFTSRESPLTPHSGYFDGLAPISPEPSRPVRMADFGAIGAISKTFSPGNDAMPRGSRRGRLFELVDDGGDGDEDHLNDVDIVSGMLNDLGVGLFQNNAVSDVSDVDIEAISLMGIGGPPSHSLSRENPHSTAGRFG